MRLWIAWCARFCMVCWVSDPLLIVITLGLIDMGIDIRECLFIDLLFFIQR